MNPLTAQQITRHEHHQAPRREATVLFRVHFKPIQFIRKHFSPYRPSATTANLEKV